MPLSFCFVGLLNIVIMFGCDLRKVQNILYFVALILLQIGYFIPPIEFNNFSLNVPILLGLLFALVGAVINMKLRQISLGVVGVILLSTAYLIVNSISSDYLVFLKPMYFFAILGVLTIFVPSFSSKLFISVLCIILCEIGTIGLIKGDFAFYPMFTPDILSCLISLVYLFVGETLLGVLIKRRRYVKDKTA